MFFEATFADATLLQKTIAVLHDLVGECSASIDPSGICIHSMDTSHVCLVSIKWPAEKFRSYHIEGSVLIGLHVTNFLKILKCSNKSDAVTIRMENRDSDTMLIAFSDDVRKAEFSMKLIDRDDEHMTVPDMEFTAVAYMEALQFLTACKDLSTISDTTCMSVDAAGLTLTSRGDIGSAVITYENIQIRCDMEMTQSFALRYLNSFAKASIVSANVALKLCPDMPLVLEFRNDASCLTFFLAPKIDDENDTEYD